ncbi:hypothetical protein BKA70DRAFT_1324495 [Coprinopsis sp. MPI-PUGE-AT-0042]|nr:hypothetical protein BKA70DRAFT_1324495 [Coprinopsis sp. MPI-PUGE-AT-0042]
MPSVMDTLRDIAFIHSRPNQNPPPKVSKATVICCLPLYPAVSSSGAQLELFTNPIIFECVTRSNIQLNDPSFLHQRPTNCRIRNPGGERHDKCRRWEPGEARGLEVSYATAIRDSLEAVLKDLVLGSESHSRCIRFMSTMREATQLREDGRALVNQQEDEQKRSGGHKNHARPRCLVCCAAIEHHCHHEFHKFTSDHEYPMPTACLRSLLSATTAHATACQSLHLKC